MEEGWKWIVLNPVPDSGRSGKELNKDGRARDDWEFQCDVVRDDGDDPSGDPGKVVAANCDEVRQDGGGDAVEDHHLVTELYTTAGDRLGNIQAPSRPRTLEVGVGSLKVSFVFEADCDGHIFTLAAPDGHRSQRLPAGAVKVDQQLRYEFDHPALVDPLHPEGVGEAPDPVVLHQAAVSGQYWPELGNRTLSQVHYLDPAQ